MSVRVVTAHRKSLFQNTFYFPRMTPGVDVAQETAATSRGKNIHRNERKGLYDTSKKEGMAYNSQ
jgi:hypothetical protein